MNTKSPKAVEKLIGVKVSPVQIVRQEVGTEQDRATYSPTISDMPVVSRSPLMTSGKSKTNSSINPTGKDAPSTPNADAKQNHVGKKEKPDSHASLVRAFSIDDDRPATSDLDEPPPMPILSAANKRSFYISTSSAASSMTTLGIGRKPSLPTLPAAPIRPPKCKGSGSINSRKTPSLQHRDVTALSQATGLKTLGCVYMYVIGRAGC